MTVSFDKYMSDLVEFSRKNNRVAELKVYTSPMENGGYHKEYCWSNGETFYEVNERYTEEVEVEVKGVTFKMDCEFMRTEYWTTRQGSNFVYQRWAK